MTLSEWSTAAIPANIFRQDSVTYPKRSSLHLTIYGRLWLQIFLISMERNTWSWLTCTQRSPLCRKYLLPEQYQQPLSVRWRKYLLNMRIPDILRSNNGPQYVSAAFTEFTEEWEFQHTTSSLHYPASNGFAELMVKIIKTAFKKTK